MVIQVLNFAYVRSAKSRTFKTNHLSDNNKNLQLHIWKIKWLILDQQYGIWSQHLLVSQWNYRDKNKIKQTSRFSLYDFFFSNVNLVLSYFQCVQVERKDVVLFWMPKKTTTTLFENETTFYSRSLTWNPHCQCQ